MGGARTVLVLLVFLGLTSILVGGIRCGTVSGSSDTVTHASSRSVSDATSQRGYLFEIWGAESNGSGTWPCGSEFSFPVTLFNATSYSAIPNVTVLVQDSMGDSISALNGSETHQSGPLWFEFLTQTQIAATVDTITATAAYNGTILRATYNLTISIQAFSYTVEVEALPQVIGQSSVQSGASAPFILDVDWRLNPIHSVFVVLATSEGETLASFLYEPGQSFWYVTAPSVSSPITLQIIATASELGVVLGQSNTTLRVVPAPLQPGSLLGYIGASWLVIVSVVIGMLTLVAQILVWWLTRKPLLYVVEMCQTTQRGAEASAVAIWNRGRTVIAPEDILPSGGLAIRLPPKAQASLVPPITGASNATNFRLTTHEGQTYPALAFDYWPPRDGVLLRVTHPYEHPEEVALVGAIKNGGEVLRSERTLGSWLPRYVWPVLPLVVYVAVVVVIITILFPITYPGTNNAEAELLTIVGGPFLAIWLSGKFSQMGPSMPKYLRREFNQLIAGKEVE